MLVAKPKRIIGLGHSLPENLHCGTSSWLQLDTGHQATAVLWCQANLQQDCRVYSIIDQVPA